jgi:formylglycine-generating enzyme required for sulfatase activity
MIQPKTLLSFSLALGAWSLSLPNTVRAQAAPAVTSQEIPGTLVKFDMVSIPGGESNGQKIAPFKIGRTEVTWDEYDIYAFRLDLTQAQQAEGVDAKSRPSKPYGAPDRGFGHQGYPALAMTLNSAQQYCAWLSKKTGKTFRLPTEAEWEYAARANTLKAEPMAAGEAAKVAWYWDTTEDKTQAVAQKAPNAWGLYDTLGNVWEWCSEGADKTNAKGVVRGGGYLSKLAEIHPGARAEQTPKWNENDPQNPKSKWWLSNAPFVGFRVVCEN